LAEFHAEHAVKLADPALLLCVERLVINVRVADKNVIHADKKYSLGAAPTKEH
jgi:hypothetical protein